MNVSKKLLLPVFGSLFVLLYSYFFVPLYFEGDQKYYIAVYDFASYNSLADSWQFYQSQVSSKEPIYFFLVWTISHFVEKNVFVVILNFILSFLAMSFFYKNGVNWYVSFFLVACNYYFLILYLVTERLKVAVIFLAISFLFIKKHYLKFFFVALSVLTHASIVVFFAAYFFGTYAVRIIDLKIEKTKISLTLIVFISLFFISSHVLDKTDAYISGAGIDFEDLFRTLLFFLASLFYNLKNKKIMLEIFFVFLALVFFVAAFGQGRVNMFSYFFFLYYVLPVNKGVNFGIILFGLYFFYTFIMASLQIYANNYLPA